jgi:hypothetical protein
VFVYPQTSIQPHTLEFYVFPSAIGNHNTLNIQNYNFPIVLYGHKFGVIENKVLKIFRPKGRGNNGRSE